MGKKLPTGRTTKSVFNSPTSTLGHTARLVRNAVTPALIKPEFRTSHRLGGSCYIVSEAFYHLVDGKRLGWKIKRMLTAPSINHWWLESPTGRVWDLSRAQFAERPDYSKGIGAGFLTRLPSARAQILIDKVNAQV